MWRKKLDVSHGLSFVTFRSATTDQVVLDDVSFVVWPAELKLMLGESGGGKSTVIKLARGLEKPDAGEVLIDGEDIAPLSEEELDRIRNKMGVVFQEGALFDSLTVFENVAILRPQEPFVNLVGFDSQLEY